MAFTKILVEHPESQADIDRILLAEAGNRFLAGQKLMRYVRSLMGGARKAKVIIQTNAVKASGTVTLSSFVEDDTVTVNGVVFTGKDEPALGTEFETGVSDTSSAAALAAAINAHATLDGMVVASSALGVVTITALQPGEMGNAFTLAISAHGSVSAARMAGGTNGGSEKTHYYGSAS